MPKGTNKSDGSNLFNINNLDQAKRYMQEISDILDKQHSTAIEYQRDTEKLEKTYQELSKLSFKGLKDLMFDTRGNNNKQTQALKDYIQSIREAIRLQEQELKYEASKQVYIDNEKESLREIAEFQRNQKKLLQDKNKLEEEANKIKDKQLKLIEKEMEQQYNKLSGTQKFLINKNDFIRSGKSQYIQNFNANLNSSINSAFDNGEKFGIKDIQRISKESAKSSSNATDNFIKGTKGLSVASTVLTEAGNVLKKAGETLIGLFKTGIANQRNAYQDTFQNLSVRNDISRSEYYSAQAGTNNILNNMGLYNNIRTSDVQKMWSTLSDAGLKIDMSTEKARADTTAHAIETVLTKNIVPYLDASNLYFQQLVQAEPTLMKQVRGIGTATMDIVGSNTVANKYLEDMIETVSPVASLAESEIGVQYAKASGTYESLVQQGFTDYDIGQFYNSAKDMGNQLKTLRNGSPNQKYALISGYKQHLDMSDFSNRTNMLLQSTNRWAGINTGTGNMDRIAQEAIQMGIASDIDAATFKKMSSGNYNIAQAIATGNQVGNSVNRYANLATSNFANDKNQTNQTLQETTLENFMNELAVVNEWMGHWTEVAVAALNGIKTVLMTIIGGKILGALGGKGAGLTSLAGKLSGTGTYIGAGLANGFSNAAPTALGAGRIGAFTGTAGAVAGAAGVAAGGAMAVKGGMDVYNDFQSGNVNAGTALSGVGAAGGAVGAGALLALGASNPIGWIALAVGGAALLGRSLYDSANNYEKAGKEVENQFNQLSITLDKENQKKEENLLELQEQVKDSKTVEEARQKLIQSGILSDEDLQKAQKASKEELEKLTQQYIDSTRKFSDTEQELLEEIKNDKVDEANQAAKSIKEWFEDDFKKNNNDDNVAIGKNLMNNMAEQLNQKGRANWSDDEKKFMERYEKNVSEGKMGYDDIKWVLEGGGSWWGMSNAVMSNASDLLTNTGFARFANARGKNIKQYESIDMDMLPYATAIINATSKEETQKAVDAAKQAGMKWSQWKDYMGLQEKLDGYGIEGFRYGLDKVPYDNYIASLHEGEAVLTASTASEMRNLVDEYRDTKEQNANFDVIIQGQTEALLTKIDEVIGVINGTSTSSTKQNSSNENGLSSLKYNMTKMKNTKSWAR